MRRQLVNQDQKQAQFEIVYKAPDQAVKSQQHNSTTTQQPQQQKPKTQNKNENRPQQQKAFQNINQPTPTYEHLLRITKENVNKTFI